MPEAVSHWTHCFGSSLPSLLPLGSGTGGGGKVAYQVAATTPPEVVSMIVPSALTVPTPTIVKVPVSGSSA